jgi:glycerol-3-phosphate acyltransferase PlsX
MGGDHGPPVIVGGALKARRELPDFPEIVFYGDEAAIRAALAERGEPEDGFEIVHTTETIDMHDAPATAVRSKQDAPIVRAMRDIKAGLVSGIVSAGSTGAMVAGALFYAGRLPEVQRPAIATWFPNAEGGCVVLDVGANSENKPEHLAQFGCMGKLFAEAELGRSNPRVGLLNIGEESSKGSELYVKANELLRKAPVNFVGNVEGTEIMKGSADVVVCDGFTGNVVLKLAESMVSFTMSSIVSGFKESVLGSLRGKLGALLLRPQLGEIRRALHRKFDYAEHGGAPLLGVNGTVIISHGKSNEMAIKNAIRIATRFHEFHTIEQMENLLANLRRDCIGA